jgi:hypothetical protein
MIKDTKKSTPKKKELTTRRGGNDGSQQYMSPRARSIADRYEAGEITSAEAVDLLGGKGKSAEVKNQLARALGTQTGEIQIADIHQKGGVSESPRTQTRKPGFSKGGMVKKAKMANCGASVAPSKKR